MFQFLLAGNLLFCVRPHNYSHKKYSRNGIAFKYIDGPKYIESGKEHSSTSVRGTIYCSNQQEKNVGLPSDHIPVSAKVVYAAAPAMSHNQVLNLLSICIIKLALGFQGIIYFIASYPKAVVDPAHAEKL